jgi:hypothetical protein
MRTRARGGRHAKMVERGTDPERAGSDADTIDAWGVEAPSGAEAELLVVSRPLIASSWGWRPST